MRLALLPAVVALALLGCSFLPHSGLETGDCFDPPDARGAFLEVALIPCGDPHLAEVFYAGTYPVQAPYDELALSDYATDRCIEEFEAYTGRELMSDPEFDAGWWIPSEDDWTNGSRRVICYAVRVDGEPMSGSVRQP